MRILVWHVHGSYMTSLVHGPHEYLIPVVPDRGPEGRGRARTWDWPPSAREVTKAEVAAADVDLVILQRPEELDALAVEWLGGRVPGRDVPAVYLEHNAPQGRINEMRHPAADRADVTVVHVTHFNALFWDTGSARSRVVEHGIVDTGHLYSGVLERAAVAINEPVRRGRVTGTDLLPVFEEVLPLDIFGMKVAELGGIEDPPQGDLHRMMAERRLYLHPIRWTSLGLSLLEAMHLGMPVVALGTTEVAEAVPPEAGVVSNRIDVLRDGLRWFRNEPEAAQAAGKAARAAALERYGLRRFLDDWNAVFEEVTA